MKPSNVSAKARSTLSRTWLEGTAGLESGTESLRPRRWRIHKRSGNSLSYLGENGARRQLRLRHRAGHRRFVGKLLRTDGRSSATINKLVRKYLSAPFEKARAVGKIKYNPVRGTSPEKTTSSPKETFIGRGGSPGRRDSRLARRHSLCLRDQELGSATWRAFVGQVSTWQTVSWSSPNRRPSAGRNWPSRGFHRLVERPGVRRGKEK